MAAPRWLSDSEHAAWRGFLQTHAVLTALLNRELTTESGLSLQDYGVLVGLTEHGRMRPVDLGRALGWEKSRLSHHLSRMIARGLVAKEECPSDRRGQFLVVTAEGRRAIEAAAPAHVEAVRRLFIDRLTDDQLDVLATISRRVVSGLQAECDGDGCG
jgi:DNA-binding MarR family transcriptional regulator